MPCSGRPSRRLGSFTRKTVPERPGRASAGPHREALGLAGGGGDERQERRLARRDEAASRCGPEGGARLVQAERAEQLAPEIAVLAGDSSLIHEQCGRSEG